MWVHFGWGNIGKSLISNFLVNDVVDYKIFDINYKNDELIELKYEYFDGDTQVLGVNLSSQNSMPNDVNVISTSVISTNIVHLIPTIQKLIDSSSRKVAIVSFENSNEAIETFKNSLTGDFEVFNSVVDKIAISSTRDSVKCERYSNIKIPREILDYVSIPEKYISNDIKMEHAYKINSVNTLHATIAYLALYHEARTGEAFVYLSDFIKSEAFISISEGVKNTLVSYLFDKYGKEEYDKTLNRFIESTEDTIERIGRNPHLKIDRVSPFVNSEYYSSIKNGMKFYTTKFGGSNGS